jgi:hypothetical protein
MDFIQEDLTEEREVQMDLPLPDDRKELVCFPGVGVRVVEHGTNGVSRVDWPTPVEELVTSYGDGLEPRDCRRRRSRQLSRRGRERLARAERQVFGWVDQECRSYVVAVSARRQSGLVIRKRLSAE